MLPAKIDSQTPTAELEEARHFLADERLGARMPLAVLLVEALVEIVRLRKKAGETFGGRAGYKRVTLCGSRRFAAAFEEWSWRLKLEESAMVYAAQILANPTADQKTRIDLIWFAQIEGSDEIFVLDVDGYVGESTAEEIAFARERGVKVRMLSEVAPGWTDADCRYAKAEG